MKARAKRRNKSALPEPLVGPSEKRAQQRFAQAVRFTTFAAILHGTCGVLLLLLVLASPDGEITKQISRWIVDLTNPLFGMVRAIERCKIVSVPAIAISATLYLTSHVLIVTWCWRATCGQILDYAKHGGEATVFQLGFVDWLFKMPFTFVLGCGGYWVTFHELVDGTAITCATNPLSVWIFRIGFTSVVPFFCIFLIIPFTWVGAVAFHGIRKIMRR